DKTIPGSTITISGDNLKADRVKSATVMEHDAIIVEKKGNAVQIKVPMFPNLPPGTRSADVSLEGEKGTVAKSTFTLITLPQISKVDPDSARSGATVQVEMNGNADGVEVFFGNHKANVVSQNQNTLSVQVPAVSENIPNAGLKIPVTLGMQGI